MTKNKIVMIAALALTMGCSSSPKIKNRNWIKKFSPKHLPTRPKLLPKEPRKLLLARQDRLKPKKVN